MIDQIEPELMLEKSVFVAWWKQKKNSIAIYGKIFNFQLWRTLFQLRFQISVFFFEEEIYAASRENTENTEVCSGLQMREETDCGHGNTFFFVTNKYISILSD